MSATKKTDRDAIIARMQTAADNDDDAAFRAADADLRRADGQASQAQAAEIAELRSRMADLEQMQARRGGGEHRDDPRQGYSLTRAIAHVIGAGNVDAGRELEVAQELRSQGVRESKGGGNGILVPASALRARASDVRAVTTSGPAGGPGANVIPEDYRAEDMIDLLRANLVTARLGATTLSDLQGNLVIPKLTKAAVTGFVQEGEPLPESDQEFGQVRMTPKIAGGIVEFSRLLVEQASPDVQTLVAMDTAASLARVLDAAALDGSGENGQPRGILNNEDVPIVDMADPTFDGVLTLIEAVEEANANVTGLAMRPAVKRLLRRTGRFAGDSITQPILADAGDLDGVPVASSTLVPEHTMIAGDWTQLLIGTWTGFELLANPFEAEAYKRGHVKVRALMTCDIAVRHPEAFAASVNVGFTPDAGA